MRGDDDHRGGGLQGWFWLDCSGARLFALSAGISVLFLSSLRLCASTLTVSADAHIDGEERSYEVLWSTNLAEQFDQQALIPGPLNTYTNVLLPGGGFYRVSVQRVAQR